MNTMDATLLRSLLQLDAGAAVNHSAVPGDFETLFTTSYWPVVRSLTAAFDPSAPVEEAVQEAFVRAFARWSRVQAYDAPVAWIRRVAINRLRDVHRSEQRRLRAEDRAVGDGARAGAHCATEACDDRSALIDLLMLLPERQRLAMALHYVEDLPVRDVAASLGITTGAVKSHLSAGRARLGALLERRRGRVGEAS